MGHMTVAEPEVGADHVTAAEPEVWVVNVTPTELEVGDGSHDCRRTRSGEWVT